jgi:defect-in-organelle-trafficking protein DotC
MKFKKLICSLIVSGLFSSSLFSQELSKEEISSLNSGKEDKGMITAPRDVKDTLDSDYLYQYYKENNQNGRVQIDYSYLIEKPLNFEETITLSHPYFKKHISNLSSDDVDTITKDYFKQEIRNLRTNAIFDEGLEFGIQTSMYNALTRFESKMDSIAAYYDNLYNFKLLMLYNGRVVPPIVLETNQSLEKESNSLLRTIDRAYTFYEQAKVTITPPSFRDYVMLTPLKPGQPNVLALPLRGKQEEKIAWQKGVIEGWSTGTRQAYLVLHEAILEMARDYAGMFNYNYLLAKNIVTLPEISESDLGINKSNQTINIGESTFKITQLPEFNSDGTSWKPLPRVESFFDNFYITDETMAEIDIIRKEVDTIDHY